MAHPNGGRGNPFPTKYTFAQAYELVGRTGFDFRSPTNERITASQSLAKDRSTPIIVFVGENSCAFGKAA